MKLTTRSIEALKAKADRYEVWEDNGKGFGVRVTPTNRKTFVFMYRFDGRARRMTLGAFPRLSLAKAHRLHAQAREQLEYGVDPGAVQTEKNRENRSAPTVNALIEEYIDRHARTRKRSWREDKRILERELLHIGRLGNRKARSITRRDILLVLDRITERGAPIMANRVLAAIRKMFNFAITRDIVSTNPCANITAPSAEKQRDRILNEDEIKKFWEGISTCSMSPQLQMILKLVLVTAQRKGEVLKARKDEFDLTGGWWTISAETAKNGKPHRVPLNPTAISIVQDALETSDSSSPFLFSTATKRGHPTETALNKALSRALQGDSAPISVAWFTPHDLRRTAASHMASLGVSRLVIAKVLNHAERGVTAIYDRHSYDTEKRKALEAWGRKLDGILSGNKGQVVTLTA